MIFNYDEQDDITDIDFDDEDLCFMCLHQNECPLIKCLQCSIVYPASQIIHVKFCDFFK